MTRAPPLSALVNIRSSLFWRSSNASISSLVRFRYLVVSPGVSLISFLTASQNVCTVWWTFPGSQFDLFLKMFSSVFSNLFSFPKCDLSRILLKNWFVSSSSIFLSYLPGVGEKFRFLPSSLKAGILKLDLLRLMAFPKGSSWYFFVVLSVSRIRLKFA